MKNQKSSEILSRLWETAHNQADVTAVVDQNGERKTSYQKFFKIINSYAYYFMENKIHSGDIVVLELDRTMEHYAARLACWFIGAAFLSVNPETPEKRKQSIYEECKPAFILREEELKYIRIQELPCLLVAEIKDESLGYLVYTSGSTGKPKGILHDRGGILLLQETVSFFKETYAEYFDMDLATASLDHAAVADFTFVLSVADMVWLFAGKTIHIISSECLKSGVSFKTYLVVNKIQSLFILPSVLYQLMPLPDLKLALTVGEPNVFDFSVFPNKVFNLYGASECPVISFEDTIYGNVVKRTLGNGQLTLSEGDRGEICFRGLDVMIGYIGHDDLNRETIEVDQDGNRILHTHDYGVRLEDGRIQLSGRCDAMVKIRGQRVDTFGVEHAINDIEEVYECAVKAFTHGQENYLCGYYSTKKGEPLEDRFLRDALSKTLNSYMIPAKFVHVPDFKRNEHGKIDRYALEEPAFATTTDDKNEVVEDLVLAFCIDAFSSILNIKGIKRDSGFIACGGSSLSAMKLLSAIHEEYGVTISAAELLGLSTPDDIADVIHRRLEEGDSFVYDQKQYSFDMEVPLTQSQLNIYLDIQLHGASTTYNLPGQLHLANCEREKVEAAICKLLDLYPILRARVKETKDGPILSFDAKINVESITNEATFVRPFDLHTCLCHFGILEKRDMLLLFCDFHHLIADGTSLAILLKKMHDLILEKSEANYCQDDGILRRIAFEQAMEGNHRYQLAQSFFEEMLADAGNGQELAVSESNQGHGRIKHHINLDQNQIDQLLKDKSITRNQLFTSAFAYTLSRYSSEEKAYFCLIEDGRSQIDLSSSVGMFVTTLPIVIDCSAASVDDFLKKSSKRMIDAMSYDFYPFHMLASKFNLTANIQFQYSHQLLDYESMGMTVSFLKHDIVSDLSVNVGDETDGIFITIAHRNMYSLEFCQGFAETFERILKGLMEKKDLSELSFVSEQDLKIQNAGNQNQVALKYPDIMDAFCENIQKFPDREFLVFENKKYTYRQSAEQVGALAHLLESKQVGKETSVFIFVHRSEYYLLCALATLAADAIYVPFDTAYPDQRAQDMLQDCQAKVVFVTSKTETRARSIVAASGLSTVIINVEQIDAATKTAIPRKDYQDSDSACIIYTSGSTGKPKGALLSRGGIANVCQWHGDYIGLAATGIYGMYPSYSFVSHIEPLLSPVFFGATVDIVPEEIRLDFPRLAEYIAEHKISNFKMGASAGRIFVNQLPEKTVLKTIMLGGEKLGAISTDYPFTIIDGYGPSEYTAQSSAAKVQEKPQTNAIGKPVYNTKCYILDKELRRLPLGACGELYLSGIQLAKGYVNRPEETKEKFIPNPFEGGKPGYESMYATGDIACYLQDGSLAYIGRKDSQVKIRGNRVELDEVNTCIRGMDQVKDCAVRVVDLHGEPELVAYVELLDQRTLPELASCVCEYVAQRKPSYMVPSFVIQMNQIPYNINGKLNKALLPAPDVDSLKKTYQAAGNEMEQTIIDAFEKVLQIQPIGVDDSFIQLGGDSLKAIRVAAILEDTDIRVADIASLETPRKIAEKLLGKTSMQNTAEASSDQYLYLKKGGDITLTLIHPAGTSSLVYVPMTKYLDSRISLVTIDNSSYYGPFEIDTPAEETVERYLTTLKRHQPEGPYYLAGWSYGGSMAYEMAFRLQERGEKVEEVIMLDSYFSDLRPPVCLYEKMVAYLPKWFLWNFLAPNLISGLRFANLTKDQIYTFVYDLLLRDHQLMQMPSHDYKGSVTFVSAIGNRKPRAKFIKVSMKTDKKKSFWGRFMDFMGGVFAKYLDPDIKVSSEFDFIEMNVHHLNMMDEEPLEVISHLINEKVLRKIEGGTFHEE